MVAILQTISDDIFKYVLVTQSDVCVIQDSLKFFSKGLVESKSALVRRRDWLGVEK